MGSGLVTGTGFLARVDYSGAPLAVNQLLCSWNQPILQTFQVSGSTVFMSPHSFFPLNPHPQTPVPLFSLLISSQVSNPQGARASLYHEHLNLGQALGSSKGKGGVGCLPCLEDLCHVQLYGCRHGVLLPGILVTIGVPLRAAPPGPCSAHLLIGCNSLVLRWGRWNILSEGSFVLLGWWARIVLRISEIGHPQI